MTDAQPKAEPAAATPSASPPLADVIAKPPRSSGRGGSLLLALAAAVAVGGIAFAAGRLTAPAVTAAGRTGTGMLPGGGQQSGDGQLPGGGQLPGSGQVPGDGTGFPGRGEGLGGMSIRGTVTAATADAITVELASGTTVTIPVDADTTYRTAEAGTSADVEVGSDVAVTPGSRVADPSASLDPNAAPGQGGGMSFGAASEVTVVEP